MMQTAGREYLLAPPRAGVIVSLSLGNRWRFGEVVPHRIILCLRAETYPHIPTLLLGPTVRILILRMHHTAVRDLPRQPYPGYESPSLVLAGSG